jgi:hypothetical protein
MRLLLALCLLPGCLEPQEPYDPYYDYGSGGGGGGLGSGWGGGGGTVEYGCTSDAACGSNLVCTRTGECLAASQVRAVHTLWTVKGKVASEETCVGAPSLSITFFTAIAGEEFGYTPVPCRAGKHTVDKLPTRFVTVQLTRAYDYSGGDSGPFDMNGDAQLDLPY